MKQFIASSLFTQSELHFDPVAISRRALALREFVEALAGHQDQPAVKAALDAWFDEVKKARWRNTAEVKRSYATQASSRRTASCSTSASALARLRELGDLYPLRQVGQRVARGSTHCIPIRCAQNGRMLGWRYADHRPARPAGVRGGACRAPGSAGGEGRAGCLVRRGEEGAMEKHGGGEAVLCHRKHRHGGPHRVQRQGQFLSSGRGGRLRQGHRVDQVDRHAQRLRQDRRNRGGL